MYTNGNSRRTSGHSSCFAYPETGRLRGGKGEVGGGSATKLESCSCSEVPISCMMIEAGLVISALVSSHPVVRRLSKSKLALLACCHWLLDSYAAN